MILNDPIIHPFYEQLAVQVLPRPAVTALARGNFAPLLAQVTLSGMIVQRFAKKSSVHHFLKRIKVRVTVFCAPGKQNI
jgi:hypothetical protein